MKPASFAYVAADTIEHALALKARHGSEARFLAGGQSLVPAMNFRMARPAILLDINPLTALEYVRMENNGAMRIGALTRHRTMQTSPVVQAQQPLLFEAAPHVAHAQIRNRGTLCGNLAHADPASEFPAVVLALEARMRAVSQRGERWIQASNFFLGVFSTALADDELLMEVELPVQAKRTGTSFVEAARRRGDFAMMGVAAVIGLGTDDTCVSARLVYCNAGAGPVYAAKASASLVGRRIAESDIEAAADLARAEIDPTGSAHATREFQLHLAVGLTRQALRTALARAN
jgi:CO/xanthine dehydrogenase FAD-binding subunit